MKHDDEFDMTQDEWDELDELFDGEEIDPNLQGVQLCFQFPIGKFSSDEAFDAAMKLEDVIRDIVETEGVGYVDGHELCEGEDEESITYFIYGDDANQIYEAVAPIISHVPFIQGSYVLKQFDGRQEHVERIDL